MLLEITWNTLGSGLAIAASLLLLIFFKDLREKFKIRVNCWFCNENTSVPFLQRNSFVCPSCRQYNGFEEDGGYNKAIPEQYDEMLNSQHNVSKGNNQPAKNGLCKLCNNNQQLKVYQLANFVPMNEDNYDLEIEHFQKQLEKAYKLCPKCDTVVKKTIEKQNRWMIGIKMKYLKEKGVKVLQKSRKELSEMQKSHLIFSSLFLLSISGLYFTGCLKKLLLMVLLDVPKGLCVYLRDYGYHNVVRMFESHSEDYLKAVGENELVLSWICAIVLLFSVIYIVYTTKTAIKNTAHDNSKTNFYKFVNTSRLHERILQDSYSDNEADNSFDISSADSDEAILKPEPKKKPKQRKSDGEYRHVPVTSAFHVFKKSPSNNMNKSFSDMNGSFYSTKSSTDLNSSLSSLRLSSKPLIAPGKLKNPWTGKFWDADTISQTSSQSSGFYSNADNCNSICGEFDCSSMYSEPVNKNSFKPLHFDRNNANYGNNHSHKFNPTYVHFNAHNKFVPLNVCLDNKNIYTSSNKFVPLNVSLDNKSIYTSSNKFTPLNISLDDKSIYSCSNKFKPLDDKSVYSCSTLKPGNIYCVGNKSDRSLFSPIESDRLISTPVDFSDFSNYQRKPEFWNN